MSPHIPLANSFEFFSLERDFRFRVTLALPSEGCNSNLDSSMKIVSPMADVSNTMTSSHWRWRRWCTKVSLGHRSGLWEWYAAARRRRVMVRTGRRRPVRRINWALYLRLDQLVTVLLLTFSSAFSGMKNLRRLKLFLKFATKLSIDNKAAFDQVVSWCHRTTRPYQNQYDAGDRIFWPWG